MTDTPRALRLWFRPTLLGLHTFAIVAVAVCIVAGLWQMGVYDSRQQHERADKQQVATVALERLWGADDGFTAELNHRPVTMSGHFAPTKDQVWVANKVEAGRTGYWLLAPFIVAGGDQALMVVRGWSPTAGPLPAVPELSKLSAVLEAGEGSGAPLENHVIGTVRIPALINALPFGLYSGYAVSTTPAASGGLMMVTPPLPGVPWTTGLRNLMYALQWWVFAAFTALMWWRMGTESVAAAKQKVA